MKHRKKISICALVMVLLLGLVVSTIPQAKANPQFVIAGWDYPDEYGQGITLFHVYENSTGAWVEFTSPTGYDYENSTILDVEAGIGIKIRCHTSLNSTLLGLSTTLEGCNYIQHSISVALGNGTVIFSQQNFTYHGRGQVGAMYYYQYEVVLDFLPVAGQVYIATVTYEVYY